MHPYSVVRSLDVYKRQAKGHDLGFAIADQGLGQLTQGFGIRDFQAPRHDVQTADVLLFRIQARARGLSLIHI